MAWQGRNDAVPGAHRAPHNAVRRTRVVVLRQGERALEATIPAPGLCTRRGCAGTCFFALGLVWVAIPLASLAIAVTSTSPSYASLLSLPFFVAGVLFIYCGLRQAYTWERVQLTQESFSVSKMSCWSKVETRGRCSDVTAVGIRFKRRVTYDDGTEVELPPATKCVILEGAVQHRFGRGLDLGEQEQLVSELLSVLGVPLAQGPEFLPLPGRIP